MSNKYPRTYHLPFSKGASKDDKIAKDITPLLNKEIVFTDKIDGSNASLERNGCFARSHAGSPTHPSFDLLKSIHSNIKLQIPENIQIFGEWLFALHSISYDKLPGYFLVFGVRENDTWLSWDDVQLWANELSLPTVPILWRGTVFSAKQLEEMVNEFMTQDCSLGKEREGLVIRLASSFTNDQFKESTYKIVRPNHVKSDSHWAHKQIIKNDLASNSK